MRQRSRFLNLFDLAWLRGGHRWLGVFCLVAFCHFRAVADVGVSATVDRQSVAVGESFTINITVTDANPDRQVELPPLANAKVLGTSTSKEMQFVNFKQSSRLVTSFEVVAMRAGDLIVPPVSISINSKVYQTKPLSIHVLAANEQPSAGAAKENPVAFLRISSSKPSPFVGEPFTLEFKLYAQGGSLADEPHTPESGLTLGKIVPTGQTREIINQQEYAVVTWKRMVTATHGGKVELGPATMAFNVPDLSRPTFFGVQYRRINLVSPPLDIDVRPLPSTNVPAGFGGAVGNFAVKFWAGPTNVAVGDPITVHVQVIGRGNYDSLTLPEQPDWREFKSYPATSEVKGVNEFGAEGTNSFEQVIVPQNAEIRQIPGFVFSYFNPDLAAYRTIQMPAVPLVVRASAATPQPTLTATNGASGEKAQTEIMHIKPDLGLIVPLRTPLLTQTWFLALQLVAPLAWIFVSVRRRIEEKIANNPKLKRKRQVAKLIRETLPLLEQFAARGESQEFHATAFRMVQERLGERLDMPASAITEAVIDERLRKSGAPEALLTELHALFQQFNYARYAQGSTAGELGNFFSKLKHVLDELEEVRA